MLRTPRDKFSDRLALIGRSKAICDNSVESQLYDAIKAFADKWGFSFNEVCELIGEQA